MSRKQSRENAFKLVYEFLIGKEVNDFYLEVCTEDANAEEKKYIETVYRGVIENYNQLSGEIAKFSNGFEINRIYKVDLAILLVAIYEIKYMKDIPNLVSINEALNMSKIYSTEKSVKFINGVLKNFSE